MLQPEPRRRTALLMRPATATSSAATAESRSGPRNFAVRWNEPSLLSTTRCGGAVVGQIHRRAPPSNGQMAGDAQMSATDFHGQRIALRRPDRREVADGPDGEADQPETQAEAHGPGQRSVHDGDGARC